MSKFIQILKTSKTKKKPKTRIFFPLPLILLGLSLVACSPEEKVEEVMGILPASTFGDKELPIYSVETEEAVVAISFDAAWGAEDFPKIMKILDENEIKTTFFVTGGWVDANPECIKTLVENGHDVGCHSEHHYDMTSLTKEQKIEELETVREKVKELTDYEMDLFRPPYGSYDNDVINVAYEENFYPIQWNVDSLDWKDLSKEEIVERTVESKNLKNGSIILMHNGAKHTAEALPDVIKGLEEKGYKIVPISKLIYRKNFHMNVEGRQQLD